jgi:hypothetical protein
MSPLEIIAILRNRLETNAEARASAYCRGDLALVQHYDADTATTLATIAKLEVNHT